MHQPFRGAYPKKPDYTKLISRCPVMTGPPTFDCIDFLFSTFNTIYIMRGKYVMVRAEENNLEIYCCRMILISLIDLLALV